MMAGKKINIVAARLGSAKRSARDPKELNSVLSSQVPKKPPESSVDDLASRVVALLPQLKRFATSLTRDQSLGDDLVQETCVRALEHIDQWRPDSRLDSWMYRIAQNLWIDQLRMQKVRGETVDIAAAGELIDCDGRVVAETRLEILELRRRIMELPADQQVLMRLIFVDGMSYREVAEAMDSPEGTVMSRLARARLALSGSRNAHNRKVES